MSEYNKVEKITVQRIIPMVAMYIDMEIDRAKVLHPGEYPTPHHGYAILLEEVEELWDEVKNGHKKVIAEFAADKLKALENDPNASLHEFDELYIEQEFKERLRNEAIHVAAVAIRFIQELC